MACYYVLCILLLSVMDTSSLPVPSLSELETHTFRWTMIIEANTSVCAIPTMNTNNPNDTVHDGKQKNLSYA